MNQEIVLPAHQPSCVHLALSKMPIQNNGIIDKIFTTNLVYRKPEILEKPWYVEVNMAKYVSYIIDTLNHDTTISELLDPVTKINALMEKHKAELAAQGQIKMNI